jgi:hypothetical protein
MMAGIKVSGIIYAAILLFVFLLVQVPRSMARRKLFDLKPGSGGIAVFLGVLGGFSALLLGGFWYVRNMLYCIIQYDSPFTFLMMQPDYQERVRKTTLAYVFDPGLLEHWKILFDQVVEKLHLPFFAALILVCLLPLALIRTRKGIQRRQVILLLGLTGVAGFLYWITPFSGDAGFHGFRLTPWFGQAIRYAFPLMGLLGVGAAVSASNLGIPRGVILLLVLVCFVASWITADLFPRVYLLFFPLVILAGYFLSLWLGRRSSKASDAWLRYSMAALLLVLLLSVGTFLLRLERAMHRTETYGPIVDHITDHMDADQRLGYVASHRSYLFYGRNLSQPLRYVPAEYDDREKWIEWLKKREIYFIAVGPVFPDWKDQMKWNFLRELPWLQDPQGLFMPVFGDDPWKEPVIYRIRDVNTNGEEISTPP